MGILDKLTGKNKDEGKKKPQKKEENVLDLVKEDQGDKPKKEIKLKEDTGRAHRILLNYHLSEKTNLLSSQGRYVFKVALSANKIEVKKAVEKVFDVHVKGVNISTTKGKKRRSGRITGRTSDWKKAVVTLKEGEKISGLAEGV
jgi:large subunit ribosomal protein L23